MMVFPAWTALRRFFVRRVDKGLLDALTNLLEAGWRRVLALMPVATGCQNGSISTYSQRMHVIAPVRLQHAIDPCLTGIS